MIRQLFMAALVVSQLRLIHQVKTGLEKENVSLMLMAGYSSTYVFELEIEENTIGGTATVDLWLIQQSFPMRELREWRA